MMGNIGPLEIGIVLIVALLVFGPKKLPELGSSMGKGIRGFGHGLKGEEEPQPSVQVAAAPVEVVAAEPVRPADPAAGG
jgi:sec-independent protein translocase protein TatA